ncbi:MAG: RHS repeat-associated core domain-containing protein [Nitrospirota bacterium]
MTRGNTTTITYDTDTNTFPLTVTNPLGHVTTTAYYGVNGVATDFGLYGQVKSVTDANNQTVTTKYDALGRKTEVTQPTATGIFTTTLAYVNWGQGIGTDPATKQHVYTTNSLSLSSWTFFDGLGRTISKHRTGPGGGAGPKIIVDTQYDTRGAVWKMSLPYFTGGSPSWRTLTYDPLGRVLQVTHPDGTTSKSCHSDWITVSLEPDGDRKRETKDAYGRVIRIDEYNTTFTTCDTSIGTPYATTTYQYDVLGNLRFVTDAKGNQSEMQYDTLARKTFMHDPDMGNWTYEYDAAGNLTKQTDAKGQMLLFQYDELNRRRQKDYATQKTLGSGDVVYTYDGTTDNRKGRLQKVQDASGIVEFRYDPLGRITRTDKTLDSTTYITESTYDGLGRLTSVKYPTSPAKTVEYLYAGPWLDQIKDKPGDGTTTYVTYAGYNPLGQPGTATFGNGVVTTYTYANSGNSTCPQQNFRPCTTKTQKGTDPAYQDLRYLFYPGGNVQTIVDAVHGNQDFSYDVLDRLILATGLYGSGGATATLSYDYDQIGNLIFNSQVGDYRYPASGASSVRPHAVCATGTGVTNCSQGTTYTYDANGNLTSGGGRTISYNFENKPTSITSVGQTTQFVYDGDGGRVKKIVGTTTIRYIGKLYECENTSCTRFIFAGNQRIATVASNGAVHYWHPDHLGSSSVITDSTGAQVQAVTYYPYGATRSNTSPNNPAVNVPYKYTGKELDETGLYFYEARYYDPTLGRFISADTLVPNPRDPQDLNRYTYAGNNPLRYTDPTGHFRLNFGKFFRRAFGDVGTAIVGVAIQFGVPYVGPLAGTAILTQSRTGRYVLAGEIIAATTAVAFACPACSPGVVAAAKGALVGEVITGGFGGYSAARSGGDISQGVLFGVAAGGLAGGAAGYTSWAFPVSTLGKFAWSAEYLLDLGAFVGAHALAGAGVGVASGATTGYASGAGDWEAILTGSYRGAAIGAALGTVLAGAEYHFRDFALPGLHPAVDARSHRLLGIFAANGVLAFAETSALAVGSGLELTQGTLSRFVGAEVEKQLRKGVKGHCTVPLEGGLNCGTGLP